MTTATPRQKLTVFTMSDSSGETAEAVARAVMVQFPPDTVSIYRLPQIRSSQQIPQLVRVAFTRVRCPDCVSRAKEGTFQEVEPLHSPLGWF